MAAKGIQGPTVERLALAAKVRALRDEGLTHDAVARRLRISRSYASTLADDPDGSKARARKDRYAGTCIECGAATSGANGHDLAPERCLSCRKLYEASDEYKALVTTWTQQRIIQAIQWWVAEYGETPSASDWSPWDTIIVLADRARCLRAERLIAEGRICYFSYAFRRFGSWNAAITAAGFTPRATHGGAGNQHRRRPSRLTRAAA